MSLQHGQCGNFANGFLENEAELIQSLYQALDNRTGFQDFLALLVGSVNGCAAQLSFIRRSPRTIDHIWHSGLSDEFLAWYLDNNMIAHDVVTSHAIDQPPGNFGSALPLIADGVPGDQYWRWESEQKMLDTAWLVVESCDTHIVLLTVQRRKDQGEYMAGELQAMDRLVPFIRQAVSLSESLHQRPDQMAALAGVIDLMPEAAFVLNSRGLVVLSSVRGNRLLRGEPCLKIRDRRFVFSDELVQALFFRTLARMEAPEGEGAPETLFVNRPDAAPLMLSVRPLGHPELMVGGRLVSIADPDCRCFPDAELIAGYFGLSPAEALLCADLATGLSLREIAEKRHKSEATVRSYLKQVYLKTGYSRQGQLISGILASLLR